MIKSSAPGFKCLAQINLNEFHNYRAVQESRSAATTHTLRVTLHSETRFSPKFQAAPDRDCDLVNSARLCQKSTKLTELWHTVNSLATLDLATFRRQAWAADVVRRQLVIACDFRGGNWKHFRLRGTVISASVRRRTAPQPSQSHPKVRQEPASAPDANRFTNEGQLRVEPGPSSSKATARSR